MISYDDLVEKYSALYGEEWRALAPTMLATIIARIDARDIRFILNLRSTERNPFSREVFTRHTGIRLPKLQRLCVPVLEDFVGEEKLEALRELHRQQVAATAYALLLETLSGLRTRYHGTVVTRKQYIDMLIAEGYTTLRTTKKGVIPVYQLWNAENGYYQFRLKVEGDYIHYALEKYHEKNLT